MDRRRKLHRWLKRRWRWIDAHQRLSKVMVVITVVIVGVVFLATFSSGDPSPLPNSTAEVDKGSPLTAEQAKSVREAGRSLALDFVRLLPASEKDIDEEKSNETWRDCTARQ